MLPLLAAASQATSADGRLGRDDGRGAIVLTSSCASMHNATNIDLTSYATSKAATDHLVKLLAAKFSRFYVRVVGINPGCKSHICCSMITRRADPDKSRPKQDESGWRSR
jgi:NAD(P)-dependent dehydrogenase (short-subunit alcohol dehydrogenase family)